MTRRILAGFIGLLALVVVGIVVPLGVIVTGRQSTDFHVSAHTAAEAVASVAEEHMDDRAPLAGLSTVINRFGAGGDRIAVLDAAGGIISATGTAIPVDVLRAASSGASVPGVPGAIAATVPVRDANRTLGAVVLLRRRDALDRQQARLWGTLLVAAGVALAVGAVVGVSLSRWIGRPLTSLATAAHRFDGGDSAAHADDTAGPPQIRQLAAAFNTMVDRITSLLEAQRSMTADVSHQLRTPLAALRLRLEFLTNEFDPAQAAEVTAMVDEVDRLDRLVDGLLAVARAEATTATPELVDLADLVITRAEAWQPIAAERRIELKVDAKPARGLARPGNTDQVLDNLIDNAIEALPAGGEITVASHTAHGTAVMTVADNGPGMTADQRTRAMHRFVTDRGGSGGMGLGLAIVERLTRSDNGVVQLTETPGGGLTATIIFPAAQS